MRSEKTSKLLDLEYLIKFMWKKRTSQELIGALESIERAEEKIGRVEDLIAYLGRPTYNKLIKNL
jgi:hypothetical protein